VYSLRTLEDSESLRQAISQASRVVVVGAGWIGSEVAASARQMGAEVVLIERGALPLERVLGAEVGAVYRDLHTDHGVELLPRTGVEAFAGPRSVEEVRTSDGRRIACDLVVVGVGAAPRVELAEAAGLVVEDGIAVDERLETSAPGVFAAGDVAAAWHPFYQARIRVEHWANALNQGPAAARSMLGLGAPYERLPYFFSDQYDLGMEYTGYAPSWDEVVFRGDPATREFIAFWMRDGRVVAGMNANVWDVTGPIGELIRRRCQVDASRLADPDVALEDLGKT
jgi:3-phenylpropionate/trans-cinnamate dioxygenase ferredoxin reductase subunit